VTKGGAPGTRDHDARWERYDFTSLHDFVETVRQNAPVLQDMQEAFDEAQNGRYRWPSSSDMIPKLMRDLGKNYTKTLAEAFDVYDAGWPEGVERVASFDAELQRAVVNAVQRNVLVLGQSGFEVDTPEFLRGVPDHMQNIRFGQKRTRSARITVDLQVRCDACGRRGHDQEPTPGDRLLARGAALFQTWQALQRAGLRPTLEGFTYSRADLAPPHHYEWDPSHPWRTITIPLAQPGRNVSPGKALFAMAHASFIRRMEFAFHDMLNWAEVQGGVKEVAYISEQHREGTRYAGLVPIIGQVRLAMDMYRHGGYELGDLYIPPVHGKHRSHETAENVKVELELDRHSVSKEEFEQGRIVEEVLRGPDGGLENEPSILWALSAIQRAGVRIK
jgi:hypothetical protein